MINTRVILRVCILLIIKKIIVDDIFDCKCLHM